MLIRYVRSKKQYRVCHTELVPNTNRIIETKELVRGAPIGAFVAYTSEECDNKIVIGWSACNTEYENFLSKDYAIEQAVWRAKEQIFNYLNAADVSKSWEVFPNHFRTELKKFVMQCKRRYPNNEFLCDYTKYLIWLKAVPNEPSLKRFKNKLEKLIEAHSFCTGIIPPNIQAEHMVMHTLNSSAMVSDTLKVYIRGILEEKQGEDV